MVQPALEVADIFRVHGTAWRAAQRGHLSLGQLKVMSAIEQCLAAPPSRMPRACPTNGSDRGFARSILNRYGT